jgi:hypothetical protein
VGGTFRDPEDRLRRGCHFAAGSAIAAVVLTLSPPRNADAQATTKPDSSGSVVALVTAKESGGGLAYSVVSVAAYNREQFTNEQGFVLLANLPAGHAVVRTRHLGYAPVETPVQIHAGRIDTIHVAMSKVAVSLNAVRIRATGACLNPGPPKAGADPSFAAIFEQLRLNADQYRLLATAYPFVYSVERVSSIHYVGGDSVLQRLDTIVLGTGINWHYRPGAIIAETNDLRHREVVFNIPALIHFAEPAFLANHCFANGGADTVEGRRLIRVDFAAASRIKMPDVDGSMYLDPITFQIKRSVLRLTKIPEQTPQIIEVEVITEFREVLPSIPLLASIRSIHTLSADPTRPILPDAVHETQRLLRVMFLKGRPGDSPAKP